MPRHLLSIWSLTRATTARLALMVDRAKSHAGHPGKVRLQGPDRARQADLPPAQCRRAHVLPLQGPAAGRNPLRPHHQDLHGHDCYLSYRYLMALMSPDPSEGFHSSHYRRRLPLFRAPIFPTCSDIGLALSSLRSRTDSGSIRLSMSCVRNCLVSGIQGSDLT